MGKSAMTGTEQVSDVSRHRVRVSVRFGEKSELKRSFLCCQIVRLAEPVEASPAPVDGDSAGNPVNLHLQRFDETYGRLGGDSIFFLLYFRKFKPVVIPAMKQRQNVAGQADATNLLNYFNANFILPLSCCVSYANQVKVSGKGWGCDYAGKYCQKFQSKHLPPPS
jgi:hypothetical protein